MDMLKTVLHKLVYFAVVACPIAGCGPTLPVVGKVSGHVTLDGVPIEGAAVMFVPVTGGRPATGVTNANGDFVLTTFSVTDGALIGEHHVTVAKRKPALVPEARTETPGPVRPGASQPEWQTPERYSRPEQSGLSATVTEGDNQFNFQLSSKANH